MARENIPGTSRGTLTFAHATGDVDAADGTYEAFTPIAQDSKRFDDLGLLTSKNVMLWGAAYDQMLTRSFSLGLTVTRALAPEPMSPSAMLLVTPTPAGGSIIGDFVTVRCGWRLYDEDTTRLSLAFTHFAPGGYLPADADDASGLTLCVEASF